MFCGGGVLRGGGFVVCCRGDVCVCEFEEALELLAELGGGCGAGAGARGRGEGGRVGAGGVGGRHCRVDGHHNRLLKKYFCIQVEESSRDCG